MNGIVKTLIYNQLLFNKALVLNNKANFTTMWNFQTSYSSIAQVEMLMM